MALQGEFYFETLSISLLVVDLGTVIHIAWIWICMTKRRGATSENAFILKN